jgi:hypothetical protein
VKYLIAMVAIIFFACSIEDPSVENFNLQRVLLKGMVPINSDFEKSSNHIYADKQANLYYAMNNGDTMKVSIFEFENSIFARAFFYNSDSISEKNEFLIDGEYKRFFRWGRRLFAFSYMFSISENSSTLDSILAFTKRFPAADTGSNLAFQSFSLKNSHADKDISVQRDYFLGIEVPFAMLARRYRDSDFSWVCVRSSGKVSDSDWENFLAKRQENFYDADSTVLISRLQNGIVAAVYGDLDKQRMLNVFREFTALIK